jgi:hypothetical protein
MRANLPLLAVVVLAATIAAPASFEPPGAEGAKQGVKKGKRCQQPKKPKKSGKKKCRRAKKPAPPQAPVSTSPAPSGSAAPGFLSLSVQPALAPSFDPGISDYVVRCGLDPVNVSGVAAPGTMVMLNGQQSGVVGGAFETDVALGSGEALTIQAVGASETRRYHVRCLPPDFPPWDFDRLGTPAHEFYVVAPTRRTAPGAGTYVVIFDDNGVPMWWYDAPVSLSDAKVLSTGLVAWARSNGSGYELRRLDGTLVRTVSFVGSSTGEHELQEAGANFLVMTYKTRATTEDLGFCGGAADQTVQDSAIQEIDASGDVVWSWNSKDHIGLDEITSRWCPSVITGSHDLVHMNSIEPNGDSIVISLRRTDSVYSISRDTGEVEWKLGGTTIPESLTPVNDPSGTDPLAGQHDARILADGTLTVHDNATNAADARAARAVRYAIDEQAGTATLLEAVSDPEVPVAGCCGSARRSADGAWLMSWGQASQVTEFAAGGARTFRLGFGPLSTGPFSYRAVPVPAGQLNPGALRAGMSAMFP